MQRRIRFITYGSSPLVGGFVPGQRARLLQADAAHFVEQAMCAEYDDELRDQVASNAARSDQQQTRKPRARKEG